MINAWYLVFIPVAAWVGMEVASMFALSHVRELEWWVGRLQQENARLRQLADGEEGLG